MKKLLFFWGSILHLLHYGLLAFTTILPTSAAAAPSLGIGYAPSLPGETVNLPVVIANNTNVVAAQFDIAFTSEKVTLASISGSRKYPHLLLRSRRVAPGRQRVLLYSLDNVAFPPETPFTAANLRFAVSPDEYVSSGPIVPTDVIFGAADVTQVMPVNIIPGAVFIGPVRLLANGRARVFLPATSGETYVVQATTNFLDWVNISTNAATRSFLDVVDADAPLYPERFYRTELITPPAGLQTPPLDRLPDHWFRFSLRDLGDSAGVVQASENLSSWKNIATNATLEAAYRLIRRDSTNYPARFYRLRTLP